MAGEKGEFEKLVRNATRSFGNDSYEAQAWFKDSIAQVQKQKAPAFTKISAPEIGSLYLFLYDAKHKATLPFFDAYPLAFPIEYYADGFLGINMHYLPHYERIALMQQLQDIRNNDKYNESTKLNISYKLLKAYSMKFVGFENCIKRYLYGHVRSSFHCVHPYHWGKAIILPLQKWRVNPNKKYAGNPPY